MPTPSFPPARVARGGERWMRNPGGEGFSRVHPASFRKGRRDRSAAEKPRLKPARSKEEPAPRSPKESPSPPGPGLRPKPGVGLGGMRTIKKAYSEFRSKPPAQVLSPHPPLRKGGEGDFPCPGGSRGSRTRHKKFVKWTAARFPHPAATSGGAFSPILW